MHERKTDVIYNPDLEQLARKKRVCAYARVSSDRDEAFHSLSAQITYYQRVIAEHPDWEFVEVFADRGITGTKENRDGFQRMLTACREGKVDIVLAKSISRFARNAIILLETVRELKSLNVDIYFEEENINTLSAEGELLISILAARAQEESRQASENQKWRIQKSYEKGIPVTGNCLGYRMVNHQFLIDEEEEQIVLHIFELFLSGMGRYAIAAKLNAEGVKTRLGNTKWAPSSIETIIHNEKYGGDIKLQKQYRTDHLSKKFKRNYGERAQYLVRDAHDPILDKAQYAEVQNEIKRRAGKFKTSSRNTDNLFSGLIKCECCGKNYDRMVAHCGEKYQKPIWKCETSDHYGKSACPATSYIPEEILIEVTRKALGVDHITRAILKEKLTKIMASNQFTLTFIFKDGTEKKVEWKHRSRRESWTPEMKAKAREQMKNVWKERKKNGS